MDSHKWIFSPKVSIWAWSWSKCAEAHVPADKKDIELVGCKKYTSSLADLPTKVPTYIHIPMNVHFLHPLGESRRLFQEAMKHGHVKSLVGKMHFMGAAGSGKTSSKHVILNEDPPTLRISTPIAERPVRVIKIEVDGLKWIRTDGISTWQADWLKKVCQLKIQGEVMGRMKQMNLWRQAVWGRETSLPDHNPISFPGFLSDQCYPPPSSTLPCIHSKWEKTTSLFGNIELACVACR